MSNIVLANMIPAAQPMPQDSDVVKVSSGKRSTAAQNDVSDFEDTENVSSSPESLDTNPPAKSKQKEDFTSVLQKQLSGNDSSDNASSENPRTSESQNTGESSESNGKTKSETDGETKKETTEQVLSAGFFVLQPSQTPPKQTSLVVTDSKTTANSDSQQAKTTQTASFVTAQAAAVSRQNAAVADKSSPAFSQVVAEVSKKMTADTVEIKNMPTAGQEQTDDIGKTSLSAAPNFNTAKESAAAIQSQLKTSSISEADKTSKGLVVELNQQSKSPIIQTKDSSAVLQTVAAESTQAAVRQTMSTRSDTELLMQSVSSSAGAEKASFQQAFLKPSDQIIDQIQTTITGPVQQIRVTLSPEELGTVRITFRQTDGQMEGLVEIQNPEVRKEVEKALPQIAAALTQNGIQIRRMDIVSMPTQQQTNQESFQSSGRDFGTADQYYSTGQGGAGSPKGGSSAGVAQQFAEQADSPQTRPRQNFDLAGLNMYA